MASDATLVRMRLREMGFSPVPVNGKIPPQKGWQKLFDVANAMILSWEPAFPSATNTGILTAYNPVIDIDITDDQAAAAAEAVARELLDGNGAFLVRIGRWPKRAIPLRTKQPFDKITRSVVAPSGVVHKIEILGNGQQVVADGKHPDTGKEYHWHNDRSLLAVRCDELPLVTGAQMVALVDAIMAMLVAEHGYTAELRPSNGAATTDDDRVAGWGYLIDGVLTGSPLHDSLASMASKLVIGGAEGGVVYNFTRALLQRSAAKPERVTQELNDLARTVRTAQAKFERPTDSEVPTAAISRRLDRPPESGLVETQWLSERLLPRRGVAWLSGQPGVGKSHVVNDVALAVAVGPPFAGHEIRRQGGVVMFPTEAADDIDPRWHVLREAKVAPYLESIGLPADTPYPIDCFSEFRYLNDPHALAWYLAELARIQAIQAARMAAAGIPYDGIALICFDTYNAGTTLTDDQHNAAGSTQSVGNMLRKLSQALDALILVVDHLGKDPARGPLGSIAKTAGADVDLRITGTVSEDGCSVSNTAMTIKKLRSGEQGQRLPFELKTITLKDGITGKVVRWDTAGKHVSAQNKRLPLLMRALDDALIDFGEDLVIERHKYRAADMRQVRDCFARSYPGTAEEGEKRKEAIKRAFNRACRDSSEKGLVGQKTYSDQRVVLYRTNYRTPDSSEVSRED